MDRQRRDLTKLLALTAPLSIIGGPTLALSDEMTCTEIALRAAIDAGDVPGVVVGATNATGTILSAAYGRKGVDGPDPVAVDSTFFIASMTKPITSVAAVQLIERGLIDPDEPVARFVPELANLEVLQGFDADGQPILRPARTEVTLRHLLTHTSGLVYPMWNQDIATYIETQKVPSMATGEKAAYALPAVFDPGSAWDYGIGVDWAGLVIEAVSGERLGDYLRANVLGPIGMNDTGFALTDSMRSRVVRMHARQSDGSLAAIDFEPSPPAPEMESGGAGLYSSVPDYLKFMRMILNKGSVDGREILKPESVERYLARNAMGDLRVGKLVTAVPFLSNDAEFFPGVEKTWSLGFMINEAPLPTGRGAGGLSWAGIANTYFWIDPANDIAGVVMMQLLPFADDKALSLAYAFERCVYDTHA